MRNIKTMLRNSRNSALLFAAASGLLYLTACSSEVNYDGGQDVPDTPATKAPFSVFSGNQSRVHNFGTSAGTRAAVDFTMPECPEESAYANLPSTASLEYGYEVDRDYKGQDMLIPANTTFGRFIGSATYYVAGTLDWSTGQDEMNPGTIVYVLPGGKIKLGGTINSNLTIYNYGEVEINNGLTVGGNLYSTQAIIALGEIGIDGGVYCKGTVTADKVRLDGNCYACAFIADDLTVERNVGNIHTSYLQATNMTMLAANVVLDNNGLVQVKNLNISNENTRFTVDGTNAVVAADLFNTHNSTWGKFIFAANIAIDFKSYAIAGYTKYWDGSRDFEKSDFEFQVSDDNQVIWVPADVCHPAYGTPPTTDEPIKEIVKVTEIDPIGDEIDHGDHDHGNISATCINFGPDGTAYASYHLRGKGSKGCIEVINDNGSNGLSLGSYMITDSIDYNHIIIDGDYIYVVGNNTYDKYNDGTFKGGKGAIVGKINKNFTASENKTDELDIKELTTDEVVYIENASGDKIRGGYKNAGDGNTIVKHGNQYLVTTYRGYGIINPDLSKVPGTFVNTTGSCKHIALNSDGSKAAILSLDTYNEKSSTASLKTFTLGSGESTFASVLASYDQIGTVEPVDGKNVVAFDGEDIYACLSKGGLARIRNGVVEQTRTFGSGNMPVNGLAIDENYLYVATGSFVYVLEKESMKSICHYRAENEKSANYIALRNGKIYVAYGENGIMAFQLVEKEISK